MGTLLQDIRYGVRMMAKKPGFTLISILALSLGIGANTAIFSVVNAVLLKPLPFDEPDQLVMLWGYAPQYSHLYDRLPVSAANFLDWREQNRVFENLAAFRTWAWHLTGSNEPEQIWGARVTKDFFTAIGTKPFMGRTFLPEEDQPGRDRVVILGYGLWQRRFGSDPAIIGKQITLTGQSYVVVGVMPDGFRFPGGANMIPGLRFSTQTEMWTPIAFTDEEAANRGTQNLAVMGRLKQNVTAARAEAEMRTIAGRLAEQYPDNNAGYTLNLVPLHKQVVGNIRPTLLILLGTVGFVLLIACANVANLLLARAVSRQKEIAIRTALGAGRLRLVRQLLTESVLLSLVGGAFGFLLALWGVDALLTLIPEDTPRISEISVDGRMLAFTLAVSVLTGIIFGLAPALEASKTDLNEALKEGLRATASFRSSRVRSLLVVSEIALALVLLIGAGLLIRSFMRLTNVDPGLNASNVLTMEIIIPPVEPSRYEKPEEQAAFFRQLMERVATLPGVESAGAVTSLPLSGAVESTNFQREEEPVSDPSRQPEADYASVTPDFFRSLNIPLIKGRYFTLRDDAAAPGVIIINEAMARKFWPGEDPLGRRVIVGSDQPSLEVVGIVGNIRQTALDAGENPAMYFPHGQQPSPLMSMVVRTTADPVNITAAVRAEVRKLDANLPVTNVRTMEDVLAASVSQRRFAMLLLGIFAVVALVLATVGIYGVMAYSVNQRSHEIGIRMALGAQPADILKMVVRQGMTLAAVGVCLGLVGALVLTRLMASLVYSISTTDPLTFVGIPLLIAFVALAACLIPARKATRVDPMIALRYE